MHPPKLAKFLLKVLSYRKAGAYFGDVEEIYRQRAERLGRHSADRWYRREALHSFPSFILESVRWRIIMLKHYLKTAVRLFRRDKGFSFLNAAGLAMGLGCFILLTMWVRDEIGWDRFHENLRFIYRLESNMSNQPAPLGPYLKANYPEIAEAARFYNSRPVLMRCGDKAFDESGFVLADPSVFDIFTIPFAAGNPSSALAEPNSVVLTESAATKYFGGENPIGRVLTVENRFEVRVTGIIRNPPDNSDFQFDVLGEFRILANFWPGYETHWGNHAYTTYVRLAEGADAGALVPKIARVVMDRESDQSAPLKMTPLSRIHLHADGAITYVSIFALVAVFILAIAVCNFINLTTARSGRRAREIAVRKVAGAFRPQLIKQFLSESVLLSLAALLMGVIAVALALPTFNVLTGKHFGLGDLLELGSFLPLLGMAVAVGILSGAYPAFLLSSFRPAGLLKAGGSSSERVSSGARFRKSLVITQFAISTVLMISALFIQKQLAYIRGYDLGIQKDSIVVLQAKEPLVKSREAFVAELTRRPGVLNATFASGLPSYVGNVANGMTWEGMDAGLKPVWLFVATDERYLDTLGLRLVDGRNFPDHGSVKEAPYFIINQRAAAEMKHRNPVGARFSMWGWNGTVLGVVKDFHVRPLREDIQPLLMFVHPGLYFKILVKIDPRSARTTDILAGIKDVWNRFAPGIPFNYGFLDEDYSRIYQNEQKMGREFRYFSILGILISCLGLIGLAAYITERKRKEIGIRKVLGASLPGILRQINGEFFGPILLANLVACPVAYWAMKTWLRGFAFHTNLSPWIFLASAASSLAVGLITVSFQSFKAAGESPVNSLKSE